MISVRDAASGTEALRIAIPLIADNAMRDTFLFVSGRLDRTLFGRPVDIVGQGRTHRLDGMSYYHRLEYLPISAVKI